MNTFLLQLKTFLNQISLPKKIALFLLIVGSAVSFYMVMSWSSKPEFKVLYSGLKSDDAGKVIEQLKKEKILYKVSSDGTAILIPVEKIYETRMLLASSGLPQGGGIGFELFDNSKLGMTEFVQNVNYQRALQGELSRTINQFEEIESSRVHLVMSRESLFIEDEKPATASVVVKLRPGASLKRRKVEGITHLVSSSISGLEPKNVTVVDSYGNMLAGFDTEANFGRVGTDQLAFQESIERKLENSIKTMLNSALGHEKTIVRVSCLLNFKRYERTEETFLPENKVVRSEQNLKQISSKPTKIPMGPPGQRSYTSQTGNQIKKNREGVIFESEDQSANYEIGRVTSHIVEPIGEIQRVSAAILVDGSYKMVPNKDGELENQYVARSKEEMEKIEALVKRAINFDPDRNDLVEVVNIPFQQQDDMEMPEEASKSGYKAFLDDYREVIKLAMGFLAVVFLYFVVLRPIIKWMTSFNQANADLIKQLPMTVNEIENQYDQNLKALSYKEKAEGLMKSKEQASATVIKEWLQQT